MIRKDKILFLLASLAFNVAGFLQLDQSENIVLAGLSFLTACSFSGIKNTSKSILSGDGQTVLNGNQAIKVALVTFLAVVVSFGIGFGSGKLLYHLIN
ncbi:MAG: hypothetical protein AAGH46_13275 [Bacteroidota bacterium]